MYIPSCTYRIQLNRDFNFENLNEIIDYLHELGVSTIYASPVTTAVEGSNHGYDGLNSMIYQALAGALPVDLHLSNHF